MSIVSSPSKDSPTEFSYASSPSFDDLLNEKVTAPSPVKSAPRRVHNRYYIKDDMTVFLVESDVSQFYTYWIF